MTIHRGGQPLGHADLLTEKLPRPLMQFMQSQQSQGSQSIYMATWKTAIELRRILQNESNDRFQVDSTALDRLIQVSPPADFGIHWKYDRARQILMRVLKGADGYLGDGWFWHANQIWSIAAQYPLADMRWIARRTLDSQELFEFMLRGFAPFQNTPPFHCDLRVESRFAVQLSIRKLLKRSMDVQITSNMPELARSLAVINGDADNLISGVSLLPGWKRKLPGALLDVARSGQPVQLSGHKLAAFLQDDFLPLAPAFGVDISQARQTYKISDAAHAPLTWIVQHKMIEGIGQYSAVPHLNVSSEVIPVQKIIQRATSGDRFLNTTDGWLEITPAFQPRLAEWQRHNLRVIRLTPQEVLGSEISRTAKMGLQMSRIELPPRQAERQHVMALIETMRVHGVPVGVSGLQQEISTVFASTCARILRENQGARILWLLPRRKRGPVIKALQTAHTPFAEDPTSAGAGVTFVSPEKNVIGDWTLIIFQDLDVTSTTGNQSRTYAALRRNWSLCTFMRPEWHRDVNHANAVMMSLGMSRSDLPAFLTSCVGRYTDQTEGIFSVLTSPFRKLTLNTEAPEATAGIPIPPRHTPKPAELPRPITSPAITMSVARPMDPAAQFVAQAKQHVHRVEQHGEPVPFVEYWPTYSSMNQTQQRWYFYWRTQLRAGHYLPTDKSYLFVHIYEVLNLVGFDSADAAFERLVNLWRNYRFQYQLDGYLINWTADFLAVHRLSPTPLEWYATVLEAGGQPAERDTAIEAWLSLKKDFTQIPMALLKMVSEYDPLKSKFYGQYAGDIAVQGAYGQAIAAIDTQLKQHTGKGLFETHRPNRTFVLKHQPFGSALVAARPAEITIAEIPAWSEATSLTVAVTSILKYTENLLRRQRIFRGTLRGVELNPEWATALDTLFPIAIEDVKAPKKSSKKGSKVANTAPVLSYSPIVIDVSKVSQLTSESDEVRERLIVHEAEDETLAPAAEETVNVPLPSVAPGFDINRPIGTPAHLLTDLGEVNAVLAGDYTVITLLQYLRQNSWQAGEHDAHAVVDGEFLSRVVDRVNERASEYLGDQLIVTEGELLIVTEDYRDELEHLFDHPITVVESAPVKTVHTTLAAEWSDFVTQMQPVHWDVLQVLLTGVDVQVRLDDIARSVYKTVDLLIDEINAFAYASINDIVILAGDPPVIEEEDVESLRALWQWEYDNVLQV